MQLGIIRVPSRTSKTDMHCPESPWGTILSSSNSSTADFIHGDKKKTSLSMYTELSVFHRHQTLPNSTFKQMTEKTGKFFQAYFTHRTQTSAEISKLWSTGMNEAKRYCPPLYWHMALQQEIPMKKAVHPPVAKSSQVPWNRNLSPQLKRSLKGKSQSPTN